MQNLISFIQDRFKDLNPWQNIKILHSNIMGDILAGISYYPYNLPHRGDFWIF